MIACAPAPKTFLKPDEAASGLALYVHWPFCKAKCPYCDFNSHVRATVDQDRWADALCRELVTGAARVRPAPLESIFFGGGTPSLMPAGTVERVIDTASTLFPASETIEITLEANPTSVEAGRFRDYRQAGVNRVSLGIQAFEDDALRFLGREHSAGEAMRAIELAATCFPRFSFDLIYGRPDQTVAAWQDELRRALGFAVGHLSLYQLTIEQGTRFATLAARGDLLMPDDERQADLYEATQQLMVEAGMPAYEVSNHARPGEECRHNLVYWRYGDYLGVGPGAHGRVTAGSGARLATRTERLPERWLAAVEEKGEAMVETTAIDPSQQVREYLMMGLRLREGVSRARIRDLVGQADRNTIDEVEVERLARLGFLTSDDDRLAVTPSGLAVLNSVLERLIVM